MSFNKKQLKKDSPKKNAIDLKLKPIKKNPNYKYGFSEFQPREGNLMLGAGFGNSKVGMGAMGMTPLDAENRKYFKGLVDANINYNVNPNLNFRLGVNDVIGGGFNPGLNAGIKLKFEEGGEYVDLELDDDDIEYYKNQGYLVEYLDGGNVLPTDPPKKSDKATTHKDKIKNYKTDLEEYNKKAKGFEEYDKGYNQRENDWKNNYNSYKEKLNKDWGEARGVPDWKIGLNNADGRGVDYLINEGFDIDDITWNDLHWVQQNIIKEGEGFNSSRSFIKPVLNKFTEEYTGVNPTEPTKPKVTLPKGYSYKRYPSRDGDMNDYFKGNKRISREEFIEATGYAPTQFRVRKVRAKFAAGGEPEKENKDAAWAARIRKGLGPEYANYNDQQIREIYDQGNVMSSFGEDFVAPELDEVTITSETDKERRDAYLARAEKYFAEGPNVFDQTENKEWIKNWVKARNATGNFENQLGNGQMERGFKSLDEVKKIPREEMAKIHDEASYWQIMPPAGMYFPGDQKYFAEPTLLQKLQGHSPKYTDVHEQGHVFDIGTSGLTGTDMEEIPETSIHKAIKNIPTKGGYETEEYLPAAEIYAELIKFRRKNKINPNKVFTEDDLPELRKKLKEEKKYGLFRLDDIYGDKEILRLMNEVATVDTPQKNNLLNEGQLPIAQEGGSTEPEYMYLELDDAAIQQYKNGGWVVEEMPEYEEGGIISPGDGWEYKQEGDTYFTKKEGASDWIDTSGQPSASKAIQTKYFPNAPIERSADASAIEANVAQPVTNTSAPLPGNPSTRAIQNDLAQEIDGQEGYYLGPKGVDGLMGDFTRDAMAAKKAGITPAEYNKQFSSTPLQSLPGASVPTSVVQRANGITPPVSSRLSASAEYSLSQSNERDDDMEQGYRTPVEEYDPAKLWEGDTEHIIGVDLGDEVYQHVDDFIYDTSLKGKGLDALAESGGKFGVDAYQMKLIQGKATSCLKGAKECNKKFVATKVGANSIAGLINQLDRADLTKYSVPSRGGNQNTDATGAFEHTIGYDAWEAGNAMVGEGLAQYLYKVSPDSHKDLDDRGHPKETMQDGLKKLVSDGKVPLGSLVMMGDSSDEFGSKYTSSKTGPRDTHAATVVGFNEKGVPMIYDYGDLVPITENVYHYGINSIVVPKGYENYTYDNLLKGKQKRNENLGYTNEYVNEKFEPNKNLKPYVNQIKKGAHEVKYKIGSDYNVKADVMDKLSDRIVGIAGQESNFGNQGSEDVSWLRQAAIELESDWTNKKMPGLPMGAKTFAKLLKDTGTEEKKGWADWEIEVMASKQLGYGDMRKAEFKAKYNELRNKYPESTGKDKDPYNSSVGPFAVKNLPEYAKDELGLSKDLLYGMDIDDKDEMERGAKASLIHLVESFINLRSEYDRETYTDDQIIDLATVAYNNKSKAFNPDFAEYYIKNAQRGRKDDYLSKVKALEYKYAYDNKRKQEIGAAARRARTEAWYADHPYTNTAATGQSLIEQQRAEDTVPVIQSESTSINRPAFEQYPQVDLTRPRSRGQRDTRSGEEQSTTMGLGSNARSVYTPTSQPTIGRPVSSLHLRNYRKYGGEIKPKDIFIEYLKRKKGI